MYARILLCTGYKVPLWYTVPAQLTIQRGCLVTVPLRTQKVTGFVLYVTAQKPAESAELKAIIGLEQMPRDNAYLPFIGQLGTMYQVDPTIFIKRIQQFLHEKEYDTLPVIDIPSVSVQMPLLTKQQEAVYAFVSPLIKQGQFTATLVHGVTGSGKTEIYKQCILTTFETHKTVLFLLPEVTLALEFEQRLQAELPHPERVVGFHSGKTAKQKKQLWQRLVAHEPMVIVGVHQPVLLPIGNLGLIIVDEEHDSGFQEKKHPKINSKHAALLRAQLNNVPIILGSATPSMHALYQTKLGNWKFFQLTERFGGTFPVVKLAQLQEKKNKRDCFWITSALQKAIENRLAKKEQVILFLNRRGFSFFVQCSLCAYVFKCAACSVSLTLHEHDIIRCHYCGYTTTLPNVCTGCKAPEKTFIKKGIGTQQAVTLIQKLFPTASVARADMDTSSKKKSWQETITNFKKGNISILVGTQTVTKGYHFPGVTLVGVLWADMNMHFPLFNATEQAVQQLIQVAGRAGRASTQSEVIVQMMDEHRITSFMDEVNYLSFFKDEIERRIAVFYPPISFLVEIELKHGNARTVEQEAHQLAVALHTQKSDKQQVTILGPAKPIVHKIQHIETRTIFVKSPSLQSIIELYKKVDQRHYTSRIFFTPLF